jgi:hypothetical protein
MVIALIIPRVGSMLATAVARIPPGVVGGSNSIRGATVNPLPVPDTVTDPTLE